MTTRTARKTVTFTQAFELSGIGIQPAGSYEIETDEELIDDISFLAWRRIATTIHIRGHGVVQTHPIDPVNSTPLSSVMLGGRSWPALNSALPGRNGKAAYRADQSIGPHRHQRNQVSPGRGYDTGHAVA